MARSELGTKRTCPVTGRKFYDLNKDPIISPYTGQIVPVAVAAASTRSARPSVAEKRPDAGEELVDAEAGEDVELISLEDADEESTSPKKSVTDADDIDADDEDEDLGGDDDAAFIEDDEDSDEDVSDLIDSDISDDEET